MLRSHQETRTRLSVETVGKAFVDKDGQLWRHVSYCEYPSAIVERIYEPQIRRGGAVGCPLLEDLDLRLLVPEGSE